MRGLCTVGSAAPTATTAREAATAQQCAMYGSSRTAAWSKADTAVKHSDAKAVSYVLRRQDEGGINVRSIRGGGGSGSSGSCCCGAAKKVAVRLPTHSWFLFTAAASCHRAQTE